jgi:hypothetical protein
VPGSVFVFLNATEIFPYTKTSLEAFDVDAEIIGYNPSTQDWLSNINPSAGHDDEMKARLLIGASYAKPFDLTDDDMAQDLDDLLAAIAGNTTQSIGVRHAALKGSVSDARNNIKAREGGTRYTVSTRHAVKWGTCSAVFSCLTGTTCSYKIDVGKAPRGKCESRGGQSCCVSWSTYHVRALFFQRTWTNCNQDVKDQGDAKASCEGYGGDANGGDVCLSNRASGCT